MKCDMRNKVVLQFPSGSTDANGDLIYIDGATVWSAWDVRPPRGREIHINDMKANEQTRWILIRYIDGVNSGWRVKFGTKRNPDGTIVSQIWEIASPPIDFKMQHRELYLELKVMS